MVSKLFENIRCYAKLIVKVNPSFFFFSRIVIRNAPKFGTNFEMMESWRYARFVIMLLDTLAPPQT